ncbi:MAG: hypothetical protein KJ955_03015, partial [Nanoarchaeota archaeon]|nr:hypothetical protein [Nanoarchaeota archaeon]
LEEGVKLLAEAEDALKADRIGTAFCLDAGTLSRLEQLSAPTDAMVILRRQAAYRERFASVLAGIEDYKARHPVNAKPAVLEVTADSILLENFGFTDADGNIVEHYGRLRINTDVEKDDKGQILFFTAYNGEKHLEQKGMMNMSLALHCNFLGYLLQNKDNAELMRVLDKYRDKGNGNGGHRANTIFAYGAEKIIHNPYDADFPSHGGNSNINVGRRKELSFSKKGLKPMPLEQALKDAAASRFVRQATCMEHPEQLVQIGRDIFKQEAYLWVPNGDASDCNDTRAAWLGCVYGYFYVVADVDLVSDNAVRGVRRS